MYRFYLLSTSLLIKVHKECLFRQFNPGTGIHRHERMNPPPVPTLAAFAGAVDDARGIAFLRLGFRPFYLGAATLACLGIPLWVISYLGRVTLPLKLAPVLWHTHEMLFGFAAAVIIGFLLTAGRAWTGRSTPRGAVLDVLAALWLAARLAALGAPLPRVCGPRSGAPTSRGRPSRRSASAGR
jgi:hypothetical protein